MNRILPLFLTCFFFCLIYETQPLIILFLLLMWFIKYRDYSVFIVLVLLFGIVFYTQIPYQPILEGKVTQLTSNSLIIEKEDHRTLVSNCSLRDYDSYLVVKGTNKPIESAPSSFGFSFESWAKQNGISSSVYATDCQIIKEGSTVRSLFQKWIDQRPSKEYLYKTFFNVSNYQEDIISVLNSIGFPFVGFLFILRKILKYFLYEDKMNWVEGFLIILNCLVTGFSFTMIRILISFCCRFIPIDSKARTGIFGILCFMFYPHMITSLSFVIPFGFRLIQVTHCPKQFTRYFFICVMQSYFFSSIHIGLVLFYPVVVLIQGLMVFYAILCLIFTNINGIGFGFLSNVLNLLHQFPLIGNPAGLGLILYLLIVLCIKKHRLQLSFLFYLFFIQFGLFHPFSELTFIQIGQGDCILLREPFNQRNILIDTGSNKNYDLLESSLKARGIRDLDVIFISHYDEDHAGNLESLKQDFNVKKVIDTNESYQTSQIQIESLNNQKYNDENDNSLVLHINMNQVSFLMMGDASKIVEYDLFRNQYDFQVDFIKIGHHGSNTSTSRSLITKVRPKVAILSTGLNNRFNHPHQETLDLLNKFNILWLNTSEEGDISILFTRFLNFILTSKGKIGIITRW
ncbi:MBL fold metallo-hydrolase [Anaerorhabdus sp.]|uniref:MBL fold metallo-hydrolase n=1 Tax=Anaerorhabdus sp. TaxID=1872524 RepID=UPI002FC90B4E